jgi:hypothetical protein
VLPGRRYKMLGSKKNRDTSLMHGQVMRNGPLAPLTMGVHTAHNSLRRDVGTSEVSFSVGLLLGINFLYRADGFLQGADAIVTAPSIAASPHNGALQCQ